MIEFEVEIKARPLGVRFAHADHGETVVVHLVLEGKVGHQLGLLPGDILIGVNGGDCQNLKSSQALDLFRRQVLPFKATFRRFEDDDEFDDDEEEGSVDGSQFQHEEAASLMHALRVNTMHQKTKSIQLSAWSSEEVLQWLVNYGETEFDDGDRYKKYLKFFRDNKIDGNKLRKLDRVGLAQMGCSEQHCQELFMAIQQLNRIYVGIGPQELQQQQQQQQQNKKKPSEEPQDDNDDDDKEDDDEPDWEAPFLPYMYDAPQIQLSPKSVVDVYTARVVRPYKRQPFALYELEVKDGNGNEWLLSKRYSEFFRLYSAMKRLGIHTKVKFPKKGMFGNNSTDKKVIEDRKRSLTEYLNELVKKFPKARSSKELNEFLSPTRTFVVDE
jgi:hypothetical protein